MKKATLRLVLTLLSVMICGVLFSQSNFLPAYVIDSKGDTLHGYIDYRNWAANPSRISFREDTESPARFLTPFDVKEFGVDTEIYTGAIVDVEMSPVVPNKIGDDASFIIIRDTLFLQAIFRGSMGLYYHRNSDDIVNIYMKENGEYNLLRYKKYYAYDNRGQLGASRRLLAENKPYIGQLKLAMSDCESIHSRIESTAYELKQMTRLFRYYYDCVDSEVDFERERERGNVQFGIFLGGSSSTMKFDGEPTFNYLTEASFGPSNTITAGVSLNLFFPRNFARFSLANEVQFTHYRMTGEYTDVRNPGLYYHHFSELAYSYLKLNNLLRYKVLIRPLEIYINAGITNGLVVNETNTRRVDEYIYGIEHTKEYKAIDDPNKHELGVMGGAGLAYNRLSLEVRYENGSGIAEYAGLKSSTQRIYFLLGFFY
ncbi:MAG: PorT family protein [Bacteroidetes bacterium]|nr:MAG: PorT family protein [Bacteroidota bacterium]